MHANFIDVKRTIIYRILCFFDKGKIIILTHGFIKKAQKTPINEIKRAEEYRTDYLKRKSR